MDRLSQIFLICFLSSVLTCTDSFITMTVPNKVSNVTKMISSLSNSMLCLACLYILLIDR